MQNKDNTEKKILKCKERKKKLNYFFLCKGRMSREETSRWTLFESIRDNKYPSLLYFVSRDHDDTIYLYNARRVENMLMAPFVDITCAELKSLDKQSRVSDVLLNNFLGMHISQEGKQYDAILHALPEKKLKFRLKKEKNRVTTSYTAIVSFKNFDKNYILEVENAEVYNVHTPTTFNVVGIPDLASISVYSRVPFIEIANALAKEKITKLEFQGKPSTVFYISETIVVTPEMKAKYDIVQLFKMFTETSQKE